jgi:hypothetical protein
MEKTAFRARLSSLTLHARLSMQADQLGKINQTITACWIYRPIQLRRETGDQHAERDACTGVTAWIITEVTHNLTDTSYTSYTTALQLETRNARAKKDAPRVIKIIDKR